jgi:hypothetical protein
LRNARSGEDGAPDPVRITVGKALRNSRAERIGQEIEPADAERGQKVVERFGVIEPIGRLGDQIVAQHVAGSVPGDHPGAFGKSRGLKAPVHRVRADAMQQNQW